ncbi:DUF3747 domain-containing protein [Synechococcus sp. LTW-R]|uniref:DUF3747 domain-containing protein n=1 Tax=Synechococcus sp. LTW-R TaxID=2751170 RepID=UPI0016246F94|nr:DUF3747 domain-containing protein [Synechococcus sp. LTW-R]QNG29318.1 DUF3747 domain-containing protein [Synechococcus sp. LTW-R]
MQRSYLPWAGLALLSAGLVSSQAAAGVFQSQPLEQERLAVLGQPVGSQGWKLLVLEQLKPAPKCWEERRDGLIDPALNRFNFSGICSRYLDSNGYSLRVGDNDVSPRYRLRLESQGNTLVLLAMSGSHPTELVVGRGAIPLRDRSGFVALKLEPGWQLERRMYGERSLSHVYFANPQPLDGLIAQAERNQARPVATYGSSRPGNGPIALQVIPYDGRAQRF